MAAHPAPIAPSLLPSPVQPDSVEGIAEAEVDGPHVLTVAEVSGNSPSLDTIGTSENAPLPSTAGETVSTPLRPIALPAIVAAAHSLPVIAV